MAEILITGLIHIDGLADTATGFQLCRQGKNAGNNEGFKNRNKWNGGTYTVFSGKGCVSYGSEARIHSPLPNNFKNGHINKCRAGEYARKKGMSNGIIEKNGKRMRLFLSL